MADENKTVNAKPEKAAAKKTPDSKWKKFIGWWAKLPKRIATPFKNMAYELKKVTWPTKRKLVTYSVVVLVFMVVLGLIISLLDMGASALVKLLVL